MKTVLITGASGDLGTHLRRELRGQYVLRLSDLRPIVAKQSGETFVRGDLASLPAMMKVVKDVDAVVALGGFPEESSWPTILRANIVGAYNLYEAARRNGVRRVLFASSNHATGFFPRQQKIDHRVYPRPDSRYGLSKVFGEQAGFLYAEKYGLEVFCMRIGNVTPQPVDKRRLSNWISPRDFAQLVRIGIDHPKVHFEIVYGVSGNDRSFYDNANATRLGFAPQDNSELYAAAILKREPPAKDPRTEIFQGGLLVTGEGDPKRKPPAATKRRR
ncbi:MAG TPA: NAD(P)-dependent oxidoreductase [Polyangia bacterium]|jgi:uronate dehydrogenase